MTPYTPFPTTAWVQQRSRPLSISSFVQLNCPKSLATQIQWTIYACRPVCSFPVAFDSSSTSTTLSELFLPARVLDYGLYRIQLTVTMRILPILSSSMVTYVKIIPSAVMVNLIPSGSSAITVGRHQRLTLDPSSFSIDPDQDQFNASVIETK